MKRTFNNAPVLHYACIGGALVALLAAGFMTGAVVGEGLAKLTGNEGDVDFQVWGALIGAVAGGVAWNEGGKRIVGYK